MKAVLYFSAKWCMPCKRLRSQVERACESVGVPFEFHDIDAEPDFAFAHNIQHVPTVMLRDGSTVVQRIPQGAPAASIRKQIRDFALD